MSAGDRCAPQVFAGLASLALRCGNSAAASDALVMYQAALCAGGWPPGATPQFVERLASRCRATVKGGAA